MSPACFEGSGTGKQEKKHNTLKNLKLAPKKQLGHRQHMRMSTQHGIVLE